LTGRLVEQWRELFPDDDTGEVMPAGMMAVVSIKAYSDILVPRPAGNMHGEQRFEIARLPRVDEVLTTSLRCVSKEQKKGRNWIRYEINTSDETGELCFISFMNVIWAA
jgi:hypothetical protein